MNEKETAAANALLEKLKVARTDEVVQLATAYQALAQGTIARVQAEKCN